LCDFAAAKKENNICLCCYCLLLRHPLPKQQQQQQGQALLLQVAHQLLLWWVAALQLWQHNAGRDNLTRATTAAAAEGYFAHHVQAVELATALAQAAGRSCTPEQFQAVTQVKPSLAKK
jgi:hypothetical protein